MSNSNATYDHPKKPWNWTTLSECQVPITWHPNSRIHVQYQYQCPVWFGIAPIQYQASQCLHPNGQRVWQFQGMGVGILEGSLLEGLNLGSGLVVPIPRLVRAGSCLGNLRFVTNLAEPDLVSRSAMVREIKMKIKEGNRSGLMWREKQQETRIFFLA